VCSICRAAEHGPNLRASAALAGTLVASGITAGIGVYSIHASPPQRGPRRNRWIPL
jgi:uncharacterized membrane protein